MYTVKVKSKLTQLVALSIGAALLLVACGGGTTATDTTTISDTPTPTPTPTPTSDGALGKQLWVNNCASCHGGDYGMGKNPSKTLSAIAKNTGGMGYLTGTIGQAEASRIGTYTANPSAY
jgi:mono/diheme cytochrome c family protein